MYSAPTNSLEENSKWCNTLPKREVRSCWLSADRGESRLGITYCHGDSDDPYMRQVICSCMSVPQGNFDPDMSELTLNTCSATQNSEFGQPRIQVWIGSLWRGSWSLLWLRLYSAGWFSCFFLPALHPAGLQGQQEHTPVACSQQSGLLKLI